MKSKFEQWQDRLLEIKGWARDGLTDEEIMKKIGISKPTFYSWQKKYDNFLNALKEGRAPVNVEIEDTFIDKKLRGYFVEEEVQERVIRKDANGMVIGETAHVRKFKRYIPPDTTAMIFYLKCRLANKYNDRLNVVVEDNRNGKLAELIEGLKEDDLYIEATPIDADVATEQAKEN